MHNRHWIAALLLIAALGSAGPREQGPALSMKPRLNVITIAVADLKRSLTFYRDGLGLDTKGIVGTEFENGGGAIVFIEMNSGVTLALYPRAALARDARIAPTSPSASEFSLGQNVKSKEDVDALMRRAAQAGAVITDPAHTRFWGGYSGYFQDPDGHLWEIAWNPAVRVEN